MHATRLRDLGTVCATVHALDPADALRRRLLAPDHPSSVVVEGEATGPRVVDARVALRTATPSSASAGDVRCCPPMAVGVDASVPDAVAAALGRPEGHRDHDLLVRRGDECQTVAVVDLLTALQALHATGASADSLTGLPGRTQIMRALEQALQVDPGSTAVAFLDLDGFKDVNDRHGHAVGDRVLASIAQRLGNGLRRGDVLGRIGGDEFVGVLQVRDVEEARLAASRLLDRVREPVEQGALRVQVGMSVGVVLASHAERDADALVADADALMYLAKQRGGGVLVADDARDVVVTRSQLTEALSTSALRLHYQPIVPLDGTRFRAVEALVRWPRPHAPPLQPASFVPLAEATGQVVDLDWWALQAAVDQIQHWDGVAGDAAPHAVHVNLSARTLAMPGLVSHVERLLALNGIAPERLVLEVTETAVIADIERARAVLTALRRIGVPTAVDDFGVGQSSLAQLSNLPVSSLKIDRSFVARLADREVDRGVVKLVRTLAEELGMDVVAEGVESTAQAVALRELGITHAQGWLWSPALEHGELQHLDVTAGASSLAG